LEDIDLKNWQRMWGKKSKWIRLWRLRERLERSTSVTLVNRFFHSSKTCSICSNVKKELWLDERLYECWKCWISIDRDVNASKNILFEGMKWKTVPKELGDQYKIKPLEIITSALYKVSYVDEEGRHNINIVKGNDVSIIE
jgi:transposase